MITYTSYTKHTLGGLEDGAAAAACTPARSKKHWRRARPSDRLAAAYEVVHSQGGKVFTLRLDLDGMVAVSGSLDPTRAMSRRIQRAFKRRGLNMPDLAFVLEVTRDEREAVHLHGAIMLEQIAPQLAKEVLREAAGWIGGHAGSRQVQFKNFDLQRGGPAGWALYPMKTAALTKRVINHSKIIYISSDLRRLAERWWEQHRGVLPN